MDEKYIKEVLAWTEKGNKELRAWLDTTKEEMKELYSLLDRVEKKIDRIKEELEII